MPFESNREWNRKSAKTQELELIEFQQKYPFHFVETSPAHFHWSDSWQHNKYYRTVKMNYHMFPRKKNLPSGQSRYKLVMNRERIEAKVTRLKETSGASKWSFSQILLRECLHMIPSGWRLRLQSSEELSHLWNVVLILLCLQKWSLPRINGPKTMEPITKRFSWYHHGSVRGRESVRWFLSFTSTLCFGNITNVLIHIIDENIA